jgi:hypothetical protein
MSGELGIDLGIEALPRLTFEALDPALIQPSQLAHGYLS